jgi:hypothetical protein
VHPEELDRLFHPRLACILLLEELLPFSPIVWYVSFEDLKPVDLDATGGPGSGIDGELSRALRAEFSSFSECSRSTMVG